MNDFGGLLASDYGFKPQGKSAPMAASKGSANLTSRSSRSSNPLGASSVDDYDSIFGTLTNNRKSQDVGSLDGFADVFGGPPKFTGTSDSRGGDSGFNFDSMFGGSSSDLGAGKSSSLPKYDKPVYDDDIFEGVPGLKSSSTVKYDDVFSSVVSPPESTPFDDFLGSLSGTGSESKSSRVKGSERVEKGVDNFDDLLPGFGGSSPRVHRHTSEASRSSKSTIDATRTAPNMMEDPFVVIGSASPPEVSSPMPFTDPLEETDKLNMYGSTKFDVSSVKGSVDDMDPLGGLGKSVPAFSSEISDRGKDRSFLKKGQSTSGRQTLDSKESTDRSSVKSPDNQSEMKRPGSNYPESTQTLSDTPKVSNSFHDFVGQTGSPPSYADPGPNMMNSQVNMSPTSEDNLESSDDVWLTVSEIALFTQPTSAPPPSRPPPPRPAKVSKAEMGSFASRSAKKTVNGFSSVPNSTQYFESSKSVPAVRGSVVSQIDQLEDFAMGRTRTNINEHVDVFSGNEVETNSDAAASAAAMKEAMDRAEAKFRHAKEVRERENAKAARSREAVQLEKDEKATEDAQERAPREKQERAEHERQRREREEELREERRNEEEKERTREVEREQRKLEKERERAREIEREREKARQAVERATREARERAAAEARLKAEKAAVEKVNAEARQRAERAAVQRAQAEARERAAAEAKERAEKAAAEARERANAEAKERAARAEVDARSRAERAAVERAAAEARQRAAAEARQRAAADARERAAAAAAAKVNQQKNEDDLESFFGVGARPSSAPKTRANSSDPLFDTQFQTRTGPELARRTSVGTASSIRKASSTTNIADDLSSIFGAVPSSGDFQEMEGESEERRRARLERHQRTQERAAKALAEKNQRDLQVQRDQAERHRIAETLDAEIKRWAAGKEGNLRALLSTMQYVLWPECGWQPVSLIDLINAASVKKVYRKATLCIHPDKVQQKGANLQQKYVAEKVFDLLKEAWNKFNSEELF